MGHKESREVFSDRIGWGENGGREASGVALVVQMGEEGGPT